VLHDGKRMLIDAVPGEPMTDHIVSHTVFVCSSA